MTAYRHAEEYPNGCRAYGLDGYICGCPTPTPDPTSPCGFEDCEHDGNATWTHPPAGPYLHGAHPHVPTLCTCGHPIEAAR